MNNDIFLIDAFSQIFRWFYAMPLTFRTPEGMPVNAIYGIGKFLFQLRKSYHPAGAAFAFDEGGSKLRLEEHPEYKSNRSEMPEELRVQIEPIKELIEAFGWTCLVSEGYEADDIIATLVHRHPERSFRIVTADKDIGQLIDDARVTILSPARSGGGFTEWNEAYITEKHGVPPKRLVEYLALVGDKVDFINGVLGIGPKTAAAIISEIESLEAYLESPTDCKWKEKLLENKDLILRNLRLVRLDVAVPGLPEALPPPPEIDATKLNDIFERYQLRGLQRELATITGVPVKPKAVAAPTIPAPVMDPDDFFGGFDNPPITAPAVENPKAITAIDEDDFFGDF